MLRKGLRLQTKEDFERVFRKGKPLFFGAVACKVAPNDLGHIRLGFSLSKKHLGNAVLRHRLRRILSESFSLHLTPGKDYSVDVVFFTVKKPDPNDFRTFASRVKNVVEYINQ